MTSRPASDRRRPAPRRPRHDRRVLLAALFGGLPGVAVALILLWAGGYSAKVLWTLGALVVGVWLGAALAVRERVVRPLQTISNLLAALREGDFSIRARGSRPDDPLGQAMTEVNALSATLREQRLGALEATSLLRKVMEEIDVAVFAFDGARRLRLVNRAGERLLGRPAERLLARDAGELGLLACLDEAAPPTLDLSFPGGSGRWEIRRAAFRQGGLPHRLLVLADVSRALRAEERQAWQRLIRVIGHELNNSLAPIKSIAGSLQDLLARPRRAADWEEDARRGLAVIAARADSLSRFMEGYARLARLPRPSPERLEIEDLVRRVAGLETRLPVEVRPGPPLAVRADGDQIEQLLINLVRNAADAALPAGGGVRNGWERLPDAPGLLEVWVEDDGPGVPSTANLFVPFFTTKENGTGIGLVLSRQIAEAHGGTLTLENRRGSPGCRARLRLPL
jgi:nitrogen fixation/metabolism regulation signal transduction histidine kinase